MPTVSATITTDVDVEIEVEVYCNSCGAHMCNETDSVITPNRNRNAFRVNACSKCMESARDEGYDKGYEAARLEYDQSR
jgi:hypothetical protein